MQKLGALLLWAEKSKVRFVYRFSYSLQSVEVQVNYGLKDGLGASCRTIVNSNSAQVADKWNNLIMYRFQVQVTH